MGEMRTGGCVYMHVCMCVCKGEMRVCVCADV